MTATTTARKKAAPRTTKKGKDELDVRIEAIVERVLAEKLGHLLDDVSWRLKHFYELADKIPAEGLNLQQHLLTGYTLTNNSPSPGYIAWTDLHVVYQGQDFGPFSGDTNLRYTWFDYDNATSKIQSSDTKPTLEKDDVLLFINDNGIGTVVPGSSQVHGAAIKGGTVDSGEIKDSAIIASKILDGAVTNTKIANNAVDANKLANNAVTASKIANNAVTTDKIQNGAVSGLKIAGGAVDDTHIAQNAVNAAHIADAAVVAQKLAAGAVSADKLNLLMHTIY